MIIKTIKLLSFDELTEKQKKKVIEKNRTINTTDFNFNYWEFEIIEKDIKPYFQYDGFKYSLSHSQGDGARIEIYAINEKAINLIYDEKTKENKLLKKLFNDGEFIINYDLNSFATYYVHYNTFDLSYEYYGSKDFNETLISKFTQQLEEYLKDKSRELEKILYENLENIKNLESDASVEETLKINEDLFNEETLEIESP